MKKTVFIGMVVALVLVGGLFYLSKMFEKNATFPKRQVSKEGNYTFIFPDEEAVTYFAEKFFSEKEKIKNISLLVVTNYSERLTALKNLFYLNHYTGGKLIITSDICNSTDLEISSNDTLHTAFIKWLQRECAINRSKVCDFVENYTANSYEEYYMLNLLRRYCNKSLILPELESFPEDEKEILYYSYFARIENDTEKLKKALTRNYSSVFYEKCIKSPTINCFPELIYFFEKKTLPLFIGSKYIFVRINKTSSYRESLCYKLLIESNKPRIEWNKNETLCKIFS